MNPRRSMHFVPGANEKMLTKSLATAADSLVLDLEDAVTPEHKDDARRTIAAWLADVDFAGKEKTVRMNPLDTPWGLDDLRATMAHPPDAYVVPKVATLAELTTIDAELTRLEAEHGHPERSVGLIPIATEVPQAVINLPTFADCPRLVAMTWGAEDLSAALGTPRNRDERGEYLGLFQYCRYQTLLCAAAGGLQPIDTVFVDLRDQAGLERDCREAAWMGYTGKMTIHPDQIDTVNAAFTPSPEQVEEARALIEAFEAAEAEGRMAFSFKGQMVDVPHLNRARALLARARATGAA